MSFKALSKWCSSGVVSAFPFLKTIDFTGFSGTFQDTAVANEKYFNHSFVSPCFAPECPVLQGISGICEMCVLADILAK